MRINKFLNFSLLFVFMVKVVDRDLENELRNGIVKDLVKIASSMFGNENVFRTGNPGLRVGDGYNSVINVKVVNSCSGEVIIRGGEYNDKALELSKEYEKLMKGKGFVLLIQDY